MSTIDQLCADAMRRLQQFINRAAGQHIRAMRRQWGGPQ